MAYVVGMDVHLLVLAGGEGRRLGQVAKADLDVGIRLLDYLIDGCRAEISGLTVVVAPPAVKTRTDQLRVLEDPPLGGPLAGIGAGIGAILQHTHITDSSLVALTSVDSPGFVDLLPALLRAQQEQSWSDGVIGVGGQPEPFDQFLMGVYRVVALDACLREVQSQSPTGLRDQGVRRWLKRMNLIRIECPDDWCRDIDTKPDLSWWTSVIRARQAGDTRRSGVGGEP